jgi:hypothetical protein
MEPIVERPKIEEEPLSPDKMRKNTMTILNFVFTVVQERSSDFSQIELSKIAGTANEIVVLCETIIGRREGK